METQAINVEHKTRSVVGRIINAIAAGDWAKLATCVSPDIVYWRPGTDDRIDGAQAYVAEWHRLRDGSADLSYTPHTVLVQGELASVEATATATMPDGTEVSYSMVSLMRIVDGLLVEEREYMVPRDMTE